MGNNVQISKSLFNALYRYHVCNDTGDAVYIKAELEEKMNRHIGRAYRNDDVSVYQVRGWLCLSLGERKTCLQVAFLMGNLSKVLLRYS